MKITKEYVKDKATTAGAYICATILVVGVMLLLMSAESIIDILYEVLASK